MRAGCFLLLALLALEPRTCLAQERSQALYVVELAPGPRTEVLYHDVERCAGLDGDFKGVQWFITAHPILAPDGSRSWGWWRKAADGRRQIVLVAGDSSEVRHEMLHDILWVSGWRPADSTDDGHPAPFGRCAER